MYLLSQISDNKRNFVMTIRCIVVVTSDNVDYFLSVIISFFSTEQNYYLF